MDRNYSLRRYAKFHHVAQFVNTHPSLKEKSNNVMYAAFCENQSSLYSVELYVRWGGRGSSTATSRPS